MTACLTTLGAIRVAACDTGQELAPVGQQPKRLALLAYLAIARPRGGHRRDSLVALLWPELDQDRARAALRQALHGLRKSLGAETLVSDGTETVELDRSAVQCDLWDLEQAAANGDHEQVVREYGGDLAQGLFVSGAPAFEQWLDRERRRVRDLVRDSAWAAAIAAERAGKPAVVAECARLALSLTEFDEDALRRAMRFLAGAGERASALSAYERFVVELRRELDAEPSDETRALAAALRRPMPTPAAPPFDDQRDPTPVLAPSRVGSRWETRRRRHIVAAGLSIVAVAAAARLAPSANARLDPRRVRVAEFINESGLAALDTLARTAQIAVRGALVRLDNAQILSPTAELIDRAGTIVRADVRVVGDSVELRAEVVARSSGAIVRSVVGRMSRDASLGGTYSAVDAFADRLSAAVATALYPGWGTALSQPPSYAGYRLFLDGMRSIKREQHEAAAAAFRRAFDEDSSFTAAGLLAASEYYQMKRFSVADSMVRAIAPRRALVPAVDGHLLDWLTRSLHGDRIGARAAMGEIVKLAPTAELAWLQLAIDNVETARPLEALAALDHIDRSAEFGEGWASYWATRAEALHILGDHRRELATVRDGLNRHPDLRVLVTYELRALAALGRANAREEIDVAVRSLVAEPDSSSAAPSIMRQVALELAAHGQSDASKGMFRQARAWYVARPVAERATLAFQLGYARTLYLADDRAGARTIYDSLLRAHPKCLDCVGVIGVLAARTGDRAAADSNAATLAGTSRPFSFGRNSMWLARIAAALGDRDAAAAHLTAAFAAGAEFDVMTHTDVDLFRINPDSVYRAFARPYGVP